MYISISVIATIRYRYIATVWSSSRYIIRVRGKKTKKTSYNPFIHLYIHFWMLSPSPQQCFIAPPRVSRGAPRPDVYNLSIVFWFTLGPPTSWMCPENLNWKIPRRHVDKMPKLPSTCSFRAVAPPWASSICPHSSSHLASISKFTELLSECFKLCWFKVRKMLTTNTIESFWCDYALMQCIC